MLDRKFRANRSKSIDHTPQNKTTVAKVKKIAEPELIKTEIIKPNVTTEVPNAISREQILHKQKYQFLKKFKDMMTEEELKVYKSAINNRLDVFMGNNATAPHQSQA